MNGLGANTGTLLLHLEHHTAATGRAGRKVNVSLQACDRFSGVVTPEQEWVSIVGLDWIDTLHEAERGPKPPQPKQLPAIPRSRQHPFTHGSFSFPMSRSAKPA
jgi:hypothetical protein